MWKGSGSVMLRILCIADQWFTDGLAMALVSILETFKHFIHGQACALKRERRRRTDFQVLELVEVKIACLACQILS